MLTMLPSSLQGNLKQTIGVFEPAQFLPGAVDLRGADLHVQSEALSLQRLKEAINLSPALDQRPVLTLANLLPVSAPALPAIPAKDGGSLAEPSHALFQGLPSDPCFAACVELPAAAAVLLHASYTVPSSLCLSCFRLCTKCRGGHALQTPLAQPASAALDMCTGCNSDVAVCFYGRSGCVQQCEPSLVAYKLLFASPDAAKPLLINSLRTSAVAPSFSCMWNSSGVCCTGSQPSFLVIIIIILNCLQVTTGVPAPYSGVKAIVRA